MVQLTSETQPGSAPMTSGTPFIVLFFKKKIRVLSCPGQRDVDGRKGLGLLLWAQPQGPSPPSASQGFQQKFTFHSKEIVAISCSWCKQAVSATPLPAGCPLGCAGCGLQVSARPSSATPPHPTPPLQYHSKVSCFMLQQIEEPCSLGVHAAVVIPPTWILRARRPQVSPTCARKP